jgi:tRNA modification GTPase
MYEQAIAAIATPTGAGGIGTVRISGENAIEIADKIFKAKNGRKLSSLDGYTALYGNVFDGQTMVDEAVALIFKGPKSYTGEDVAELSVHGGEYVVRALLRAVLNAGAVPAEKGEFTKRAFLNGKMSLSEAEAVMDIISADGEQALNAGLEALGGAVSKKCDGIKDNLKFAAATVSAFADFPDEEPEFSGIDRLGDLLKQCETELKKLLDTYDTGRMVKYGINTVIIGPPNAGKSTLMNLISGYDRSIVTSVAGTTRDIVEETVNFGGVTLRLSDTAGLRETDDMVEKIGVEKTKERLDSADLVIAVFDGSSQMETEKELLDFVKNKNVVAVYNKADIGVPKDTYAKNIGITEVFMSAKNGDIEELSNAVKTVTGINRLEGTAAVFLNERQRNCAKRSYDAVVQAENALKSGITVDAVGVLVDEALAALLELSGERVTNEVADEVFSKFCVGK